MNRLKDKVAIISGVGRRFGQASALLFAREGAKVFLTSRSEGLIESTSKLINGRNGQAVYKMADANNSIEVNSVVESATSEYGKVDILLNNAGGFYSKKSEITEMEVEDWERTLSNNMKTVFNFTKALLPIMKLQGNGSIINISAAPKTLLDGNSAYAAVKGGIISLTRNLAFDYYEDNIRVNCVCPGVIRIDTALEDDVEPDSNLNRRGIPEDVANAILYLASDESSWVTGQALIVDGGESLFLNQE